MPTRTVSSGPSEALPDVPIASAPRDRSGWYQAPGVESQFHTSPEVAKMLRINVKTAYEMARSGRIESILIGRKRLVAKSALAEVMARGAR